MGQQSQREMRERRLRHQLEIQSMQIERVFSQHDVPAKVAGGTVQPQAIRFDLQMGLAQGLERLKALKDDLMRSFGGSGVRFGQENGRFNVEVDRQEDVPVPLLDLLPLIDELPPVTAVMGLAEDERPVLLNFTEEDMTHILIAGDAGAGKTTLLRTIAISLAMHNRQSQLQMLICHPAAAESGGDLLEPLSYLPHMLASVVKSPAEIGHVFDFLLDEMTYRQEQHVQAPTVVVMVDQVVAVLEAADGQLQKPLTRLLRHGADVGIHLVLTTKRPKDDALVRWLKVDLPVRLVGQVADEGTAYAASGVPDSQAEYLLGSGDFLAVGNGQMTRFQAAYIGDYDLHLTLEELHRKRPPALLAQSVSTRPRVDEPETAVSKHSPQPFVYDGREVSLDVSAAKVVYPRPQVRLLRPDEEDER